MKNLFLIIVCLFACSVSLFSQGENDNWYFGNNAAINFSSSGPISIGGSQMQSYEGVASISDSNGDLLFYTNGVKIWNKNHQIMPNGQNLTSTPDASQGVIIIPYPNEVKRYIIFTTNGGPSSYDFMAYSIVDMDEDSGLGDVVELNTPLKDHNGNTVWQGRIEAITSVTNTNPFTNISHYWILMPYRDNLLAYYVDDNGVNTTPVVSQINWVYSTISQIKVSPNKNVIAITEASAERVSLYYFNVITGQVTSSSPFAIILGSSHNGTLIYSSEFSISGENLWISAIGTGGKIFGFDMNNLSLPPVVFSPTSTVGTLQRGKDNEIYVARNNGYIGKIVNSDNLSSATFSPQEINLVGSSISRLGLPQLVSIIEDSGDCPINIVLNTPETNNSYLYESSNSITTHQNYEVSVGQNIILSAGNFIEILPNTNFVNGSIVLAEIEGCIPGFRSQETENFETIIIYLDLDEDIKSVELVQIYPNPTEGIVTISSISTNLSYELFSVTGNKVASGVVIAQQADFSTMQAGIYFIKIKDNDSGNVVTKKLVIK